MKDNILKRLENLEKAVSFDMVSGIGFDSHRFNPAKKDIILGGVKIPYHKGIDSHSDGDALYHALTDAIFGAAALNDIGDYFPDSDPSHKNLDSSIFLLAALRMAEKENIFLTSIDIIIILEKPSLSPFKQAIKENIARLCGLDLKNVGLKAKTNESLGFIGRGEGLAVIVSVLGKRMRRAAIS